MSEMSQRLATQMAVDAFKQQMTKPSWQPIETAPKHYKPILGCDPSMGYEAIVVHNGREWECLSFNSYPLGVGFYPTHWHPLPEPPTA